MVYYSTRSQKLVRWKAFSHVHACDDQRFDAVPDAVQRRRTSRKPRTRRGELEKGDSHAFLFETIVRLTYPQNCITLTKTTANL